MKIVSVVGGRPQFIKSSVLSSEIRKFHTEILVHTGQHYDYNMSELFFEELGMPKPDYNLGISGGSHAQMTGRMMMAIEEVFAKESPDWVLVYGDMNSTLAAALAAVKLHIPICHVESGVRTHSMQNPEEVNRICTDHVSSLCLACAESAFQELVHEGLGGRSILVGDPMYDAFLLYRNKRTDVHIFLLSGEKVDVPKKYCYMTCHREENTNDSSLIEILSAMESLDGMMTIYPVHPRNKERVIRLKQTQNFKKIFFVEPVGYLESLYLVDHAEYVVTDSGGLSREAFFAHKKCVTIFDHIIHPETMVGARNQLARPDRRDILAKIHLQQKIDEFYMPYGNGHSACACVKAMEDFCKQ